MALVIYREALESVLPHIVILAALFIPKHYIFRLLRMRKWQRIHAILGNQMPIAEFGLADFPVLVIVLHRAVGLGNINKAGFNAYLLKKRMAQQAVLPE